LYPEYGGSRFLRNVTNSNTLNGITSQKFAMFLALAVKASNLTFLEYILFGFQD
jgi:hypothetical protein